VYAQKCEEPAALANKPDMPEFLNQYVEAFTLLSAQRELASEGGGQALDILAIIGYASELEVDDRELFIRHMLSMDKAFRQHFAKRMKK
jgi:hypothetical protein